MERNVNSYFVITIRYFVRCFFLATILEEKEQKWPWYELVVLLTKRNTILQLNLGNTFVSNEQGTITDPVNFLSCAICLHYVLEHSSLASSSIKLLPSYWLHCSYCWVKTVDSDKQYGVNHTTVDCLNLFFIKTVKNARNKDTG